MRLERSWRISTNNGIDCRIVLRLADHRQKWGIQTMKNAKHTIALAVLVMLALPLSHYVYAAVPPPGEDLFGMYADDNFNDDASDENPTFVFIDLGVVQVYIYLTNVSAPSIGAYEFTLAYSGPGEPPIIIDLGLPPGGMNFGSGNEYYVGFGIPLLPDEYGHAILMSPQYFVSNSDPVYVSVTPASIPSIPDQISYVEYDDTSIFHAMNPASGNFVDPIFAFNTGLLATEDATWSGVKALYR